jgi:replicative DNA helicase
MNFIIDDNYCISMDYIKSKSRALKKKNKCTMIIIDYLQLIREEKTSKNTNREQEISIISRKCKLLSKELEVPVFALSQLSREVEKRDNKTPRMSDLRESGSLEQDADIIGLIHRPEQYGIIEDENGISTKGIGQFIIEKNKEGKVGIIQFKYNESLTIISDIEDKPIDVYYNPNERIEPNTDF